MTDCAHPPKRYKCLTKVRPKARSPMASQDESPLQGLKLYWPALGTVLITVWGLIIARPALVSSRPTSGPVVANRSSGDGRAPARLWQDPLTAVMGPSATDKAEQPDIALSKIFGRYCAQ